MKRKLLILLLIVLGTGVVIGQEKQKVTDTVYHYFDFQYKLIKQDGTKVHRPVYKHKYYYDKKTEKYKTIECKLIEKEQLLITLNLHKNESYMLQTRQTRTNRVL